MAFVTQQTRDQRDQIVENAVAQLLDMTADSGDVQPVHINELLPAYMDTVQKRMDGDESTRNLLTGIVDLDNATGGINPQDLIVVAGRPGMGKTEFALTVVEGVTSKGRWSAHFQHGDGCGSDCRAFAGWRWKPVCFTSA